MVAQLVSDHCVNPVFSLFASHKRATMDARAAGPRAKRLKIPKLIQEADTDGAMDIIAMSQFVRDLCRQHKHDREAWIEVAETLNDHARFLDEHAKVITDVNDELLQINDDVAKVVDGAIQVSRNQEQANKQQVL